MSLQSILPSLKARPASQYALTAELVGLFQLVNDNFSLSTWLLLGACLQASIALVVKNKYYAFLPAVFILSARIIDALLIHFNIKQNPYLQQAIMKKAAAIVPDSQGNFTGAGQEKVTIMLLGAKTNHPFGALAADFLEMNKYIAGMNAEFEQENGPNGFLGQTFWTRKDERGAMEFVFISYWRSIEDLHAYAHGPLHRQAWVWWEKTLKQHDFLGINHEIYEAEKGHWENVYVNFQPTGLGATTYLRRGDGSVEDGKVGDEWISPLVQANKGPLRSSTGRLGRSATKYDADRPNEGVY